MHEPFFTHERFSDTENFYLAWRREFQPRSPTPSTSQTADRIRGEKETCGQTGEGWGTTPITLARPSLMLLTTPVCCAPSHDPGHHDSPRVLIPPDGGTLHQRQSRPAPQKHLQTYTLTLNSTEPPRSSLCHHRGQIGGDRSNTEDAINSTSGIDTAQHFTV